LGGIALGGLWCASIYLASKQEGKFQVGESLYMISTNKI
jgi:hypothetical protein